MSSQAMLELILSLKGNAEKEFAAVQGEAKQVAKAAKEAGAALEHSGGLGAHAGGLIQQAFSFAAGGALLQGVQGAFGALSGGLESVIQESSDAAEGQAALNAVLESTKGKAGVTADAANDLASNLQLVTKFTDDQVLAGENMLLTFTNIGSKVFPQATETVLNMAQAFGGDTSQAAVQLGKALNDPIAGISALSRVGVSFTDQQKDQIAAMVAAGDAAGAQGVILKELNTEFGGAARAAGSTFAGGIEILHHRLDDFKQAIGDAVLPMLQSLVGWLNSPPVQTGISAIIDGLIAGLQNAITLIGQVISTVGPPLMAFIQLLAGFATGDLGQIAAAFTALPAPLQALGQLLGPLVANFAAFFQTVSSGGDILGALVTLISANFQHMLDWILSTGLPLLVSTMVQAGTALWNWIAPQIGPALAQLAQWGGQLADWVMNTGLPALWNTLLDLGTKLWQWVEPQIGPALVQLSIWGQQVGNWIMTTGLPLLWQTLQALGQKLVDWIGPMIPPALAALGQFLGQAVGWIVTSGIPLLVGAVAGLAFKLVSWIAESIPKAQEAIRTWFSDFFASVGGQGETAHQSFWEMAGHMLQGLVDGLTGLQHTVHDALVTMWDNMVAAFKAAAGISSPSTVFIGIAGQLIAGLVQGLQAGWHLVMDKVHELAMLIPQPIRDALGIHSPSQETADLGGQVTAGLAQGIGQGAGAVLDSLAAMGQSMVLWGQQVQTTVAGTLAPLGGVFQAGLAPVVAAWQAVFGTTGDNAGADNILLQLFNHDTGFFAVLGHQTESILALYVGQTWGAGLQSLSERVTGALEELKASAGQQARGIGEALGAGMIAGIDSMIGGIAAAAAAAVTAAVQAAQSAAQIHSPSRRMAAEVGAPLAQGMAAGMTQAAPVVAAASAGLMATAANPASAAAGAAPVAGLAATTLGGNGGAAVGNTYVIQILGPSLGSQSFWNGFARQISIAVNQRPAYQLAQAKAGTG